MPDYVGAIDQGTTSTRFIVFDGDGSEVARHQIEHEQVMPCPGYVEHDPLTLWQNARTAIARALAQANISAGDLAAVGIANQRETVVVWNRHTGVPYYNAIVWQDTRTAARVGALHASGQRELIARRTGLTPATYFSASKIAWILDNVDGVRAAAMSGDAVCGTVDSWLLWNLTGGAVHATDVTNASRTMLMDLESLDWDDELLAIFDVPRSMLPTIVPSSTSDAFGTIGRDVLDGDVVIGAVLGDQQAAMVGHGCFGVGDAKNTYGTGNFMLVNTGDSIVRSNNGLLTTVCYQLGVAPPAYALEGSVAVTGAAVQWLRDQLGIISSAAEIEQLAAQVDDAADMYFVPAFSGLFAPYWRADARGVIVGLSRFHTKAHLARATLESIAYQTRDIVEAIQSDSGIRLGVLNVDGGVTANSLCMQMQADVLGVPVARHAIAETTALGAAYAAGLAVGVWDVADAPLAHQEPAATWRPRWSAEHRERGYAGWQKAVERSLGWGTSDGSVPRVGETRSHVTENIT